MPLIYTSPYLSTPGGAEDPQQAAGLRSPAHALDDGAPLSLVADGVGQVAPGQSMLLLLASLVWLGGGCQPEKRKHTVESDLWFL
jgi:hypothetical protein